VWREFVAAWWDKFGNQEVGASDLFQVALGIDGLDLGRGNERSQRTVFGSKLTRQRDRVIGGYRVVFAGEEKRLKRWRLLPTQGGGVPGALCRTFPPRASRPHEQWLTAKADRSGVRTYVKVHQVHRASRCHRAAVSAKQRRTPCCKRMPQRQFS